MTHNIKRFVILLGGVSLIVGLFIFLNPNSPKKDIEAAGMLVVGKQTDVIKEIIKPDSASETIVPFSEIMPVSKPVSDKVKTKAEIIGFDTTQDYSGVSDWQTSHFGQGYLSDEMNFSYDYTVETLEALVEQGDFKAMHILGQKYMKANDTTNAIRVFNVAAAYGSTVALHLLAILEYEPSRNPVEMRKAMISRLPFFQVAFMRGDKSIVGYVKNTLKANAKYGNKEIILTAEEIKSVHDRASVMYQKLEAERARLNLPKFDNSVPATVRSIQLAAHFDEINTYTSGDSPLFISGD